jgi:hypothetical protein
MLIEAMRLDEPKIRVGEMGGYWAEVDKPKRPTVRRGD